MGQPQQQYMSGPPGAYGAGAPGAPLAYPPQQPGPYPPMMAGGHPGGPMPAQMVQPYPPGYGPMPPQQQLPVQQQQQQQQDEQQTYREWFAAIDADRTGRIDANALQQALRAGGDNFSSDTYVHAINPFVSFVIIITTRLCQYERLTSISLSPIG